MNHGLSTAPTLKEHYSDLLTHDPKLVTNFVPSDKTEQRRAFLRSETRNPRHAYKTLDAVDFVGETAAIHDIGKDILAHPELNQKHRAVYEQFIDRYSASVRLMELAQSFNAAKTADEKNEIRKQYMHLNIELYGEPDEKTYRSLLQSKLSAIGKKELSKRGNEVRDELFALTNFSESNEKIERFAPSPETVAWMHEVAETLYGGMLSLVPAQKDTFTAGEMKAVFQDIITKEFGESAEGWTADIEKATAVNVKSSEKRIVIPVDRKSTSHEKLQSLVVHELGVHMFRAITGGETDLDPLASGLSDYYDSEEGLGVVMEQALKGKFKESGVDHYITAGAAYFDHKDFRDLFEIKWRIALLEDIDDGKVVSELAVAQAKQKAHASVLRSFRGTDELPWFKDLAYYNGSVDMWRHLESIRGDDVKFMFVLMGKANPANAAHERILYETATA